MIAYWNNLNDRERWMLSIGGVCCVVFLFYLLIYSPLVNRVYDKKQQLIEKKETLAFLQKAKIQQQSTKKVQVLSESKLLTVLAEQLKVTSFHRSLYQLQQTGSGDIQLSFDEVPFNAFISWLWSMSEQYAFLIKQFNAERTPTPGVVKVVLIIH